MKTFLIAVGMVLIMILCAEAMLHADGPEPTPTRPWYKMVTPTPWFNTPEPVPTWTPKAEQTSSGGVCMAVVLPIVSMVIVGRIRK